MTDTKIDEVDNHVETRRPFPSRKHVLRRVAFIALISISLALTPEPVREFPMFVWLVAAPATLWTMLFRERVVRSWLYATGLGSMVSLAGWSLVEFLLLLAGTGVNVASTILCLFIVCVVPALLVSRIQIGVSHVAKQSTLSVIYVLVLLLLGAGALALSMHEARKTPDTQAVFGIFWAGMLVMYVPMFALTFKSAKFSRGEWPLTIGLAVASYLPLYVRAPNYPYLNDEIAHWGETVRMVQTGQLFLPDGVLPIGPKYPGLETLTAGITHLSGLPTITAGRLLILLCHICAVIGIAALARGLGASSRGATVAAALYAISPSMIQIDNMFSYESFAVPLGIWLLVAIFALNTAKRRHAGLWVGVIILLSATLVITHHLTSFTFALCLIGFGVANALRKTDGRRAWSAPLLTGIALLVAASLWALALDANLPVYLGNFFRFAIDGIKEIGISQPAPSATNNDGNGSTRQIFGGSVLPAYERYLTFVAQPLLFVWFALSLWRLGRRISGAQLSVALLGLAYFVSLPLTVIGGASAAAHRSWAVSFVGVAVIAGLLIDRPRSAPARHRPAGLGTVGTSLAILVLVVALVASFGAGSNAYTRFPGPYRLGADGRTVTADMIRSAEWFGRTQGPERRILTNNRTQMIFGSYGQALAPAFPQWTIFFPTKFDQQAVEDLLASSIEYIVVDRRLASAIPTQSYFASFEPPPPAVPLPQRSIAKFATASWLHLIHQDGNISVYRVLR